MIKGRAVLVTAAVLLVAVGGGVGASIFSRNFRAGTAYRFQPRHPPHLQRQLHRLPWRREAGGRRLLLLSRAGSGQGQVGPPHRGAGTARRLGADGAGDVQRSGSAHAAAWHAADAGSRSRCCGIGSRKARAGRTTGPSCRPSRKRLPAVKQASAGCASRWTASSWRGWKRKSLRQSPEADKAALLRRVSLDLTGMPPTPEEQAAFLADTSEDAYEKQVDRLLASPRYGERWATHVAGPCPLWRHQGL